MEETQDYTLAYPKQVRGQHYDRLAMRRVLVRDLENLDRRKRDKGEMAANIAMLADLCSVAPEVISALDVTDLEGLQALMEEYALSGLGKSRRDKSHESRKDKP